MSNTAEKIVNEYYEKIVAKIENAKAKPQLFLEASGLIQDRFNNGQITAAERDELFSMWNSKKAEALGSRSFGDIKANFARIKQDLVKAAREIQGLRKRLAEGKTDAEIVYDVHRKEAELGRKYGPQWRVGPVQNGKARTGVPLILKNFKSSDGTLYNLIADLESGTPNISTEMELQNELIAHNAVPVYNEKAIGLLNLLKSEVRCAADDLGIDLSEMRNEKSGRAVQDATSFASAASDIVIENLKL